MILVKKNLKLAPEFFLTFLTLRFLDDENGSDTNKPVQSKVAAIHEFPSSNAKFDQFGLIGLLNFCSNFFENLHDKLKPL